MEAINKSACNDEMIAKVLQPADCATTAPPRRKRRKMQLQEDLSTNSPIGSPLPYGSGGGSGSSSPNTPSIMRANGAIDFNALDRIGISLSLPKTNATLNARSKRLSSFNKQLTRGAGGFGSSAVLHHSPTLSMSAPGMPDLGDITILSSSPSSHQALPSMDLPYGQSMDFSAGMPLSARGPGSGFSSSRGGPPSMPSFGGEIGRASCRERVL